MICKIFCSGSTIVGFGAPDPPQFIYDEDDYKDVFVSGMTIQPFQNEHFSLLGLLLGKPRMKGCNYGIYSYFEIQHLQSISI